MTKEETVDGITLFTIAQVKSYAYCGEYNPTDGLVYEKAGANFLKQGYIDGFIAGFTYKLTGE